MMKIILCVIMAIACIQATPTLQDIQNASYHLPAGYEGEGRGEVAAIDRSHTVKFTDGRGSDKKNVYWVYGAKDTPDFTQTTKETEYKWKQLPRVEEDKSVYAVSDSIAAVLVVQSSIEHGGREEYIMLLKESQGELNHVYLQTSYGGKYTKSMSIESGKLFITDMNWVGEETNNWDLAQLLNSSRNGRSVDAPYPSAPPKTSARYQPPNARYQPPVKTETITTKDEFCDAFHEYCASKSMGVYAVLSSELEPLRGQPDKDYLWSIHIMKKGSSIVHEHVEKEALIVLLPVLTKFIGLHSEALNRITGHTNTVIFISQRLVGPQYNIVVQSSALLYLFPRSKMTWSQFVYSCTDCYQEAFMDNTASFNAFTKRLKDQ